MEKVKKGLFDRIITLIILTVFIICVSMASGCGWCYHRKNCDDYQKKNCGDQHKKDCGQAKEAPPCEK